MKRLLSSLLPSLRVVNMFWLPAAALFFFSRASFLGSLGVDAPWARIFDQGISIIGKTFFLAWIWGRIIEILSGEDNTARIQNFKFIVTKGWLPVLIVIAAPRVLHFSLFMMTGTDFLPFPVLDAGMTVVMTYWAAERFINIKYRHVIVPVPSRLSHLKKLSFYSAFLGALCMGLSFLLNAAQHENIVAPLIQLLSIQAALLAFTTFAHMMISQQPAIKRQFSASKTLILVNLSAGSIVVEAVSTVIRSYPPFFAVLRALTPATYRIIEYNRVFWREPFYQENALVAISCFTSNCAGAYKIAKEFRRHGAKVVLGGPHVSFFPDEALEFCDSVVIGPAENSWKEIIQDYETGNLKSIYRGACPSAEMKQVNQFLINSPVDIASSLLQMNRGCKFNCYFCANPAVAGRTLQSTPLDDLMALLKRVSREQKAIGFIDNNIYADPANAKELFRQLEPLKVSWNSSVSIDIAQDDAVIRQLKASGCHELLIGYEIDAESTEQSHGGKFAMAKNYVKLTRKLQQTGIRIKAHFIVGFPQDSWGSIWRLWWYCFRLSPSVTAVSYLTPLPGSDFFADAVRDNRIINLNWRRYDTAHQVVDHARLGRPILLQKAFLTITGFFLMTTSTFGRTLLIFLILSCVLMLRG